MSDVAPKGVLRVRDNGGRTIDRYSIILKESFSPGRNGCLGLSYNPESPQGFSQWSECVDNDNIGPEIAWHELPQNVRDHAAYRLA